MCKNKIIRKNQTKAVGDIAMVFSTCDEYCCIWNGFFKLFRKFFPFWDGPIFSTVSKDFFEEGYHVYGNHYQGTDKSFSTRLIKTLKRIKTKYVLFFLDDFYLVSDVDKTFLMNALLEIKSNKKIKNIVLKDFVKHEARCDERYNQFFHIMRKHGQYKATTNVSIYDRKYLLSLLRKGESAWDFEFFGTFRAHHKNALVLYRDDSMHDAIKYFEAGLLHRGQIQKIYSPYLKKFNINVTEPCVDLTCKKSTKRFWNIYIKSYPYLSLIFPFLKKKFDGYPSYIYRINHIEKEFYLK